MYIRIAFDSWWPVQKKMHLYKCNIGKRIFEVLSFNREITPLMWQKILCFFTSAESILKNTFSNLVSWLEFLPSFYSFHFTQVFPYICCLFLKSFPPKKTETILPILKRINTLFTYCGYRNTLLKHSVWLISKFFKINLR